MPGCRPSGCPSCSRPTPMSAWAPPSAASSRHRCRLGCRMAAVRTQLTRVDTDALALGALRGGDRAGRPGVRGRRQHASTSGVRLSTRIGRPSAWPGRRRAGPRVHRHTLAGADPTLAPWPATAGRMWSGRPPGSCRTSGHRPPSWMPASMPGEPAVYVGWPPLELTRHLVLGAVGYSRSLGLEPRPDFRRDRGTPRVTAGDQSCRGAGGVSLGRTHRA